jgi:hypothetical protein
MNDHISKDWLAREYPPSRRCALYASNADGDFGALNFSDTRNTLFRVVCS